MSTFAPAPVPSPPKYHIQVRDDGGTGFYLGSANGALIPCGGYSYLTAHKFDSREEGFAVAAREHPRMRASASPVD